MSWATRETPQGTARPPLTVKNFVPDKFQSVTGLQHISKGSTTTPLPKAEQPTDLLSITFETTPGNSTSLGEFLKTVDTDSFLVMHQGFIVTEEYPSSMESSQVHALASITRVVVASVTAILVQRKQLKLDEAIEAYMPELAQTGFAGIAHHS